MGTVQFKSSESPRKEHTNSILRKPWTKTVLLVRSREGSIYFTQLKSLVDFDITQPYAGNLESID